MKQWALSVLAGNGTNADNGTQGQIQDAKRNGHIAFVVLLAFSLYLYQPLSTLLLEPYSKCDYTDGIKVTLKTDNKMAYSLSELQEKEVFINSTGNHVSVLIQTADLLISGEGVTVSSTSKQYQNLKNGSAVSPSTSLWGIVVEGRDSYKISKEFGYKCDKGTVMRTNNPNICNNSKCNSNGTFCDISEPIQYSLSDDYFAVHNVWLLGIQPLSYDGNIYDGQALATYNRVDSSLTVLGVDFYEEEIIENDDRNEDKSFFAFGRKKCPGINPINLLDENVQLIESNSMCFVQVNVLCTPRFQSNTMNCYTDSADTIWIEMDADDVEAIQGRVGISAVLAHYPEYGDKTSLKAFVGSFFADISGGSEVSEEPWCDTISSLRLVRWAPFVLFVVLVYLMIVGYYIYQGRNSIVPIPSTPLDGVKIAQYEFYNANNHRSTSSTACRTGTGTGPEVPELFGIIYNNDDEATKDYYGVTTAPQPYRRPLINTPIIE